MSEITLRHELNCSEDTFWNECVFNDAFNKALYVDALKFPAYELIAQTETPDKRTRTVQISPPMEGIPGPVRKLVGEKLRYVEEGVFDKSARRYSFKIVPSTLAEKTKTSGEMWCEPLGPNKIVRVGRVQVEVKVFAVGSMLEDKILSDLRVSYDAAATFTNSWLAKTNP